MKACVIGFAKHSILAFSIDILISVIVSFRSCSTSDSDVSLRNPVTTALPWFWSSWALLGSSFLFSQFSFYVEIFLSIFVILLFVSVIAYLPSFSPWLCSFHGAGIRLNRQLSERDVPLVLPTNTVAAPIFSASHIVSRDWTQPTSNNGSNVVYSMNLLQWTKQRYVTKKHKEDATYQEPFSRGNSCQTNASNKKTSLDSPDVFECRQGCFLICWDFVRGEGRGCREEREKFVSDHPHFLIDLTFHFFGSGGRNFTKSHKNFRSWKWWSRKLSRLVGQELYLSEVLFGVLTWVTVEIEGSSIGLAWTWRTDRASVHQFCSLFRGKGPIGHAAISFVFWLKTTMKQPFPFVQPHETFLLIDLTRWATWATLSHLIVFFGTSDMEDRHRQTEGNTDEQTSTDTETHQ